MKHNSTRIAMRLQRIVCLAAMFLLFLPVRSQSFQLVKDIRPGNQPLSNLEVAELIPFGDSLIVVAESSIDGRELWLYDENPSHTKLLQSLGNGIAPAAVINFVPMHGKMYFNVGIGGHWELWVTDGSVLGTTKVYSFAQSGALHDMIRHGDRLLILIEAGGAAAPSLWSSDGSTLGTDSLMGNFYSTQLLKFEQTGGNTYFASQDQIWRTDGLPGGTVPMLPPGSVSSIGNLTAYHDRLWFMGTGAGVGMELWSCDTIPSVPTLHDDYNPQGDGAVNWMPMFVCDDRLFFVCSDGGTVHGEELRQTDGNASSATVFDWNPGIAGSYFANIAAAGHFFFSRDLNTGTGVMGNAAGLQPTPNAGQVSVDIAAYAVKGDTMIFLNGPNTVELWIAQGSLNNVHPYDSTRLMYVQDVCIWRDSVAVSARTSIPGVETLLSAAWTPTGTRTLAPMPEEANGSNPNNMYAWDGKVFFTATDDSTGNQVWVTDGTAAGTQSLGDLWPGQQGYSVGEFVAFDGKVYWADADPAHGVELWASDGTPGGTHMVVDLNPGTSASNPSRFIVTDDHLYFQALEPISSRTVTYRTDGTAQGTVIAADIFNGPGSSTWPVARIGNKIIVLSTSTFPSNIVSVGVTSAAATQATTLLQINTLDFPEFHYLNNNLYFDAPDSNGVGNLWRTNGTVSGTMKVTNYYLANQGVPDLLGVVNGKLILSQRLNSLGREIYASDGTLAGTVLLKDVFPGQFDGFVSYVGGDDQKGYFRGLSINEGSELWVTDGTVAGTTLVTDLSPGILDSYFGTGLVHDGHLYTNAVQEGNGWETLESDGTASGTYFYDFATGMDNGTIAIWEPTNQGLLVVAQDNAMGASLYLVGGGNITPLPDPTGDPHSIDIMDMAMSANGLVMSMHTPAYGRELWRLDGLSLLTGSPRAAEVTATTHAGLRAYPVPAHEHVHVSALDQRSPIAAWQLIDLGGQTLASARIAPGGACDIDLAGLPAGLYIVRATLRDGSTAAIKVVKE